MVRPIATNDVMDAEQRQIFDRAQTALLEIPGHAEYYRDRILAARLEYEDAKVNASSDRSSYLRSELSSIQQYGFRTMAYLPSVETVRVLGEFLADERGYTRVSPNSGIRELEQAGLEQPNCKLAAKALVCLPIVAKPLVKNWSSLTYDDVPPWRTWYEQIKSGKRTFRFEGDPTEYTLTGPASQELLQRIERDRLRDEERLAGQRRSAPVPSFMSQALNFSKPSTLVGLFTALLLCAVAVWYFLRGRRTV